MLICSTLHHDLASIYTKRTICLNIWNHIKLLHNSVIMNSVYFIKFSEGWQKKIKLNLKILLHTPHTHTHTHISTILQPAYIHHMICCTEINLLYNYLHNISTKLRLSLSPSSFQSSKHYLKVALWYNYYTTQVFRFLQWWSWSTHSSGIWHHVTV